MNVLVWFKRDLRVHDHPALTLAAGLGSVLPLYVLEPEYWALRDTSARQWDFTAECLTDLREAAHHTGPEDIRRIAGLLSRSLERIAEGRAAVVVSQAVSFGMMRMLQAYVDGIPFEIRIFYDLAEARRWLGLEEK